MDSKVRVVHTHTEHYYSVLNILDYVSLLGQLMNKVAATSIIDTLHSNYTLCLSTTIKL